MIPQVRGAHNRRLSDRDAPTRGALCARGPVEMQQDDLDGGEKHHLRRLLAALDPGAHRGLRLAEVQRELRYAAENEAGTMQSAGKRILPVPRRLGAVASGGEYAHARIIGPQALALKSWRRRALCRILSMASRYALRSRATDSSPPSGFARIAERSASVRM